MDQNMMRDTEQHMDKSIEVLRHELSNIRTGRANPGIIEHLQVDYYGSPTALQALAGISAPDSRQLIVQPYDRTALSGIEKAIRQSDLGFNPVNDGNQLRINIPPLTEERRREMVKMAHKRVEESKVAIRNLRRDANDHVKRLRKDRQVSEDEEKLAQEQLQKLTDAAVREADAVGQRKEAEILEV
ncbi:MAG: ribosome recycling factor [Chloroflexota bacterium]|nr:MAG: ribosome recycling factor [Chloroflexota bacterium]